MTATIDSTFKPELRCVRTFLPRPCLDPSKPRSSLQLVHPITKEPLFFSDEFFECILDERDMYKAPARGEALQEGNLLYLAEELIHQGIVDIGDLANSTTEFDHVHSASLDVRIPVSDSELSALAFNLWYLSPSLTSVEVASPLIIIPPREYASSNWGVAQGGPLN